VGIPCYKHQRIKQLRIKQPTYSMSKITNLRNNMKLNFALLIVIFFYINTCLAYNVKTDDFNIKTDEFSVIQKEVKSVDKDTLIIFDIDRVLLEPKDQILKEPNTFDYEEILGHYSYIMRNNTADQLSDKQLRNVIKKAVARGVLTRDAYLYQYNTDTNVLRCLYIQKNGKVYKKVRIITANNGEDLTKIIGGLDLPATTGFQIKKLTNIYWRIHKIKQKKVCDEQYQI